MTDILQAREALFQKLDPAPTGLASLLAPSGTLRAGINLSNFLLVSSRAADGSPAGVSPDMAAAIAAHLQLPLQYVPYENPGKLADASVHDAWDIALLGAEPQRAATIAFTDAYCEIEATCIVPHASALRSNADLDRSGQTIAFAPRTAWGLWLERNIRQATLVQADTYEMARQLFLDQKLDALGGLRPKLIEDVTAMPGMRLLEGRFMAVQQAIGVPRPKAAAIDYLAAFAHAAVTTGFVQSLIASHRVVGLHVAQGRGA